MEIKVKKLEEAGYYSAMIGLALNKNQISDKMPAVANILCDKDAGHNKFLESIIIWLEVTAPRYWWSEADTYRLSTKQSQSTMHTVLKRPLTEEDFEDKCIIPETLQVINLYVESKDLLRLKKILPEGFMQTRVWCMSYKTLSNIILQRKNHRLPHWQEFIKLVLEQVDHPELLTKRL
jgi:hypothetical protein